MNKTMKNMWYVVVGILTVIGWVLMLFLGLFGLLGKKVWEDAKKEEPKS